MDSAAVFCSLFGHLSWRGINSRSKKAITTFPLQYICRRCGTRF